MKPGFLSLNLNALAKTLEKVDLHERLYIEADLLPMPELVLTGFKPLAVNNIMLLCLTYSILWMDCAVYSPIKSVLG